MFYALFFVCNGAKYGASTSSSSNEVFGSKLSQFISARYNEVENNYHLEIKFNKKFEYLDSIYFNGKTIKIDKSNSIKKQEVLSSTPPYEGKIVKDSEIIRTNYYIHFPVTTKQREKKNNFMTLFYRTKKQKGKSAKVPIEHDPNLKLNFNHDKKQ